MLLYPTKNCLSAVEDARSWTDVHTEPIGRADDRTFYRAAVTADVGFSTPAEIVGLCVSDHHGGPLRGVPVSILDAFDCDLCFSPAPRQIHLYIQQASPCGA